MRNMTTNNFCYKHILNYYNNKKEFKLLKINSLKFK